MSIGTKIADYNSYFAAFKGNYRKGTNRFRTILENPATAEEFSASLGGTCVVLGWPIGKDDRNSQELLAMLKGSSVISQSVLTWLGQWYPEYNQDADMLYGDATRCAEIEADPLMARAVSCDPIAMGKVIVTLSGGTAANFDDINAVVSNAGAMAAIAAAPAALQALISNPDALTAAVNSETAVQAIITNETSLGTVVTSPIAMEAVVSSSTAMAAVAASQTAMAAIIASTTALNAVVSSSTAMAAVAASQTAMAAIIASTTALNAVVSSSTAMTAIFQSPVATQAVQSSAVATTAIAAVSDTVITATVINLAGLTPGSFSNMAQIAASSTAMAAVAASQTAMAAVAASSTAMVAISASSTALTALFNSPLAVVTAASAWGTPSAGAPLLSGKRLLVGFSQKQYNTGTHTSTLGSKTGGSGSGDFTITFSPDNYNTYQKMAIAVNPLLWRSNSWGGNFSSQHINGVKTIPIS